jgi:hypothetical protein
LVEAGPRHGRGPDLRKAVDHVMVRLIACSFALALPFVTGCATSDHAAATTTAECLPDARLLPVNVLTGVWESREGDAVTQEFWTPAEGGSMFGIGRTMQTGRTVFFEYLRIEHREGGLVYFASPNGRSPATEFRYVPSADAQVIQFENPAHDFPQRIIYRFVDEDTLSVSISGWQGGSERIEEWRLTRRR